MKLKSITSMIILMGSFAAFAESYEIAQMKLYKQYAGFGKRALYVKVKKRDSHQFDSCTAILSSDDKKSDESSCTLKKTGKTLGIDISFSDALGCKINNVNYTITVEVDNKYVGTTVLGCMSTPDGFGMEKYVWQYPEFKIPSYGANKSSTTVNPMKPAPF